MKTLLDPEPGLDLSVGALVVYGGHGIGRVAGRSRGNAGGAEDATVALEFEAGLSVTLPLERAQSCLRPIAGEKELDEVRAVLRSRAVPVEQPGQTRARMTRTKIAAGDPVGLAEVVRDAVERQRRSSNGSARPSAEQELYKKARRLLVAELVLAVGIDEVAAEEWIDGQLEAVGS